MEGYRKLFIWVEGNDDKRFFEKIVELKLKKKYSYIHIINYAQMRKEKIDNFLRSIKSMGADYLYVIDINNSPCVTAKKDEILSKLRNIDKEKIIVVIKEIESWYLAGIDDIKAKKLKIRNLNSTNDITKEKFNSLIPKRFNSRIDFMLEILKDFSIETAKQEK